jgi:hypothetical protein
MSEHNVDNSSVVIGHLFSTSECTDVAWFSEKIRLPVCDIKLLSLQDAGGLNASMFEILVTVEDSKVLKFILKTIKASDLSRTIGFPREAFFYHFFGRTIGSFIPKCVSIYGNMATGEKQLLMERIDGVQSGYFFGKHSPHNFNKDLDALTGCVESSEQRQQLTV